MAEEGANVVVGGDVSGATEALKKLQEQTAEAVEGVKSALEGINGKFELVGKAFAALTVAMEGGKELGEFVNKAAEMAESAEEMGRALGISTSEASTFAVALNGVDVNVNAVALAGRRITMALNQGSTVFAQLGVATKDANGNLRNSRDIMLDVNDKLREFKAGTDRNIEAQKIYGRQYEELLPMIERFTGETAESREKAEALNLVIGEESVEAAHKYITAKKEVGDVMEGVERTIGEALIPRLTELAEWFSGIGPTVVTAMRGVMDLYCAAQDAVSDSVRALWDVAKQAFSAIGELLNDIFGPDSAPQSGMTLFKDTLQVIEMLFIGFSTAIKIGCEGIAAAIDVFVARIHGAQDVLSHLMSLDFEGAKKAWDDWGKSVEEIERQHLDNAVKIAQEAQDKIAKAMAGDPTAKKKGNEKEDEEGASGKRSKGKIISNSDAPWMAALQQRLAMRKELLAEELKAVEDAHSKELLDEKAFYEQKLAIDTANINADIEAKQAQLRKVNADAGKAENSDAEKQNALKAQRLQLEGEIAVLVQKRAAAEAENERQMQEALEKRGIAMAQAETENQKKLRDIEIAGREETLKHLKDIGQLSDAEELEAQRQLLTEKYNNEKTAIEAQIELAKYSAAERQKLEDQLAQVTAQYNVDMVKNANDTATAMQKTFASFIDPVVASMQSAITQMVNGTMSLRHAFESVAQSIIKTVADMVAKKVATWLAGEAMQTAATITGTTVRTAAETTAATAGAAATVAAKAGEATAVVSANAAEAASGAAASVAPTPFVGPALAAAAFASVFALVLGASGAIKSARGGYDIPSGVNPITQLHEEEMVLPKGPANALRDIAENGVGRSSGDVHFHVNALDAASVKDLLVRHGPAIAESLRKQGRNFAFL
jgi:hypothetical protein